MEDHGRGLLRLLLAVLALLLSLAAAVTVWARPAAIPLNETMAALAALVGLAGALLGLRCRRGAQGLTRLAAMAAATLGLLTSLALVASAVYLMLRAFFTGGIPLAL